MDIHKNSNNLRMRLLSEIRRNLLIPLGGGIHPPPLWVIGLKTKKNCCSCLLTILLYKFGSLENMSKLKCMKVYKTLNKDELQLKTTSEYIRPNITAVTWQILQGYAIICHDIVVERVNCHKHLGLLLISESLLDYTMQVCFKTNKNCNSAKVAGCGSTAQLSHIHKLTYIATFCFSRGQAEHHCKWMRYTCLQ